MYVVRKTASRRVTETGNIRREECCEVRHVYQSRDEGYVEYLLPAVNNLDSSLHNSENSKHLLRLWGKRQVFQKCQYPMNGAFSALSVNQINELPAAMSLRHVCATCVQAISVFCQSVVLIT